MRVLVKKVNEFLEKVGRDHVGAYAAQSAFFLVLSLIPIILLLLTLVRYTPVTKADVMTNEVYNQSRAVIPLTALMTMWSAGRGVLAITNGLNCIHEEIETRNYIFLRIRAAFYTVLFIIAIVLSLVLLGFGNSISMFVNEHVPIQGLCLQRLVGRWHLSFSRFTWIFSKDFPICMEV